MIGLSLKVYQIARQRHVDVCILDRFDLHASMRAGAVVFSG